MLFDRTSLRTRRNIAKLSKQSVNREKYVKDFYVADGLAYISCNVREYDDVIDSMSVKGYEWLDTSFSGFIESNAQYIPPEYPIVLEICGGGFTDEQKEKITGVISDYYALKLGDMQLELENNRIKAMKMIGTAIIFAVIYWILPVVFKSSDTKYYEPFLIIFWFSLWSGVDTAWFVRNDIKEEKLNAVQLANITVIFKNKFKDTLVDEKVREEIYEEVFEKDFDDLEEKTDNN